MEITQSLYKDYAKKIYGFSYSKTRNHHDAEDLASNIVLSLCSSKINIEDIDNMDAYIYRICQYTWSKFLRKNKLAWQTLNINNIYEFEFSTDNNIIEEGYIKNEMHQKLWNEIMYLNKTRREIIIMYYYENKSSDEISRILNISSSTVRWHLHKTKIKLKERMEMNENNKTYRPIRLNIGHNGWIADYDMMGLSSDTLMQNICYICQGKALTLEEIARTLNVASIYLEDKLDKLFYMDYIKVVNSNKIQTNFFIQDYEYQLTEMRFLYENTMPLALSVFNFLKKNLEDLKKTGFMGCDLNDNFLMWCFLPIIIKDLTEKLCNQVIKEKNLIFETPKRKDGSQHWVCARTPIFNNGENDSFTDSDFKDYCLYGGGSGIKIRKNNKLYSLQVDLNIFGGWRNFGQKELAQLKRVYEIIVNNEKPNDCDKEIISNLVQEGYVKVKDGIPKLLVPYISAKNNILENFNKIINDKAKTAFNEKELIKPFYDYIEIMKKHIPSYVDKNEKNYLLCSYNPHYTILYLLRKHGYLKEPSKEEQKRICTILTEQ